MKSTRNKTGYRGIVRLPSGRFQARITLFNKAICLGTFDNIKEAVDVWEAYYEKYENKQSEFHSRIVVKSRKLCRGRYPNSTGYFGVKHDLETNRYYARNSQNKKDICLGGYETAIEAALAVNKYLDKIDDNGPRNNIRINDIIELKRKREQEQKEHEKYLYEEDMRRLTIKNYKQGVEAKIQRDIIRYLTDRQWYCRILNGNTFQAGLTDLVAFHKKWGVKFIEVKNPAKYKFTPAQLSEFPKIISHGTPIYILTAANDKNYKRLFGPSNLWVYLAGISDKK